MRKPLLMTKTMMEQYRTRRQFKSDKRRELKAVERAFDVFCFACAYIPNADGPVSDIENALGYLKEAVSCREWGR